MHNPISMKERFDFEKGELNENDAPKNPLELFREWLNLAQEQGITEYQAMCLSTVGTDSRPSSRIVYLRDLIDDQLVFYTNYLSKKGEQLGISEWATVNFFWKEQERQIRVEGKIKPIDNKHSDAYFEARPRGSQIGAWASEQSAVIPNRVHLEKRVAHFEKQFEVDKVTRPEHWGGYGLSVELIEFWQGRKSRLHDRLVYERMDSGWQLQRLAP